MTDNHIMHIVSTGLSGLDGLGRYLFFMYIMLLMLCPISFVLNTYVLIRNKRKKIVNMNKWILLASRGYSIMFGVTMIYIGSNSIVSDYPAKNVMLWIVFSLTLILLPLYSILLQRKQGNLK